MTDDDRETLTAYLDGELDEVAEQAIEARLSQEPALRAELDALKQAWGLLDYLPGTVPSNDFTHRTLDRRPHARERHGLRHVLDGAAAGAIGLEPALLELLFELFVELIEQRLLCA